MKRFLALLLLILLAALWYFFVDARDYTAEQKRRVAEEVEKYQAKVAGWLDSPETLLARHGAKAFVSQKIIDAALAGLANVTIPLEDAGGASFRIISGRLSADEGVLPTVRLEGEVVRGAITVRARAAALLLELPDRSENGAFRFRLHVLDISPTVKVRRYEWTLSGLARDLARTNLQRLTEKFPPLELFLRQELPLSFPAANIPQHIQVRGPGDTIDGMLALPAVDLKVVLEPVHLLLTKGGLHLWVTPRLGAGAAPAPAAARPPTEKVEALIARLAEEGDVALHLHKSVFAQFNAVVTALPEAQKKIQFQATGHAGNLHEQGGGGAGGQGFRVYLENDNDTHATVTLSSMSLLPANPPDGAAGAGIDLQLVAKLTAQSRLHIHNNPPKAFGADIGGGVGTNVLTQMPESTHTLSGRAQLEADDSGGFCLNARVTGPPAIKVTVQVGLGALGNIPFDASIPVPVGQGFSARVPIVVPKGKIELPGGSKSYAVKASNPRVKGTAESMALRLDLEVGFEAAR